MTRAVLLLALASLRIDAAAAAGAIAEPEIRVKAMFLYNFARFTEWPADAGSPLTFCVLGDDRLDRELETVLRGKTVADRALAVRHVTSANQIADCRVIYIGRSERNRTTQVVRSVQGKAVLVVSEYPEAGAGGATINFFMEQDKMRFSVSLAAASDAGVVISSTLLRLAKITDDKR
jgi:hypothetical protein